MVEARRNDNPVTCGTAQHIKERREMLGWTITRLAQECKRYASQQKPPITGMPSRHQLTKFECGYGITKMSVDFVWVVARVLGTSVAELITGPVEAPPPSFAEPLTLWERVARIEDALGRAGIMPGAEPEISPTPGVAAPPTPE